MSHYVIGIDGGATKTLGVLMDGDQRIRAEVYGAATNFNSIGYQQAQTHLRQIVERLLEQSGLSTSHIAGIGLGVSGVSGQDDERLVAEWIEPILPGAFCLVDNDAIMALAAATGGDLFGVVVVSGTGMIVMGVNRSGQRGRAGGWGALLGEPGSGFALGSAALRAVVDAEDGLAAPTQLTNAVLTHLHLNTPRDLEKWVYTKFDWARFAALAPLVSQCASQGDLVSRAILESAAAVLSQSVCAVARRLGLRDEPFPCVLAGGNLAPDSLLTELLTRQLPSLVPAAQVDQRRLNPAVGAAQLAMRRLLHP